MENFKVSKLNLKPKRHKMNKKYSTIERKINSLNNKTKSIESLYKLCPKVSMYSKVINLKGCKIFGKNGN